VKIIGRGELKSTVSISADKLTESAEEAINKGGGKAITL
ncbi:uL15m family ribosomal protein, partial [Chryseobacterium indologenes]